MSENHFKHTNDENDMKEKMEKPDKAAESITKTPTWNHLLRFSSPRLFLC